MGFSDIQSKEDIRVIVEAFSNRLKIDVELAPYFETLTGLGWEAHRAKMIDFWDFILFSGSEFNGDVLGTHRRVFENVPELLPQFTKWILLFQSTVDAHYSGSKAQELKQYAGYLAKIMSAKIKKESQPASDDRIAFE